jgi:hypothetical protein
MHLGQYPPSAGASSVGNACRTFVCGDLNSLRSKESCATVAKVHQLVGLARGGQLTGMLWDAWHKLVVTY